MRGNFTIVASSNVLLLCIPSQTLAAAVTEEVSFTAVPAKIPKPLFDSLRTSPNVGNNKAARILKRNITEIDWAISSSWAFITGAAAAIAEPPHIEDPTETRIPTFF